MQTPGKMVSALPIAQLMQMCGYCPFFLSICRDPPHQHGSPTDLLTFVCSRGRPSASECLQSPWLQETGLDNRQQALVTFPTTKLRNFLTEREKKRGLLCSKYGLMIAQ